MHTKFGLMHAYEFGLTPTSPKFGLMPILIFGLTTTYEIWTNACAPLDAIQDFTMLDHGLFEV